MLSTSQDEVMDVIDLNRIASCHVDCNHFDLKTCLCASWNEVSSGFLCVILLFLCQWAYVCTPNGCGYEKQLSLFSSYSAWIFALRSLTPIGCVSNTWIHLTWWILFGTLVLMYLKSIVYHGHTRDLSMTKKLKTVMHEWWF